MTQYRITTNSGKFRIEHFIEKPHFLGPHKGWYPLYVLSYDSKESAEAAMQALKDRDAMNEKPWEPV